MKYLFRLMLFCFLTTSVSALAQRVSYSKQEFGAGLTIGYGKPSKMYDNTLAIGIQGDYQFNLAKWFSLRANLGYLYTLPNKRDMLDGNGQTVGQVVSTSNMLHVGLSPLFYGRFKKANIFVGFTAAAGHAWLVTKFDTDNPPENVVWAKPAWGVSPILGCSFNVNKSPKTTGELEFLLTQFRFNNDETYSASNAQPIIEYRLFGLQVAYRFLF